MTVDYHVFAEKKLTRAVSEDAHRRYTDPQGRWNIYGVADGCGNNSRARFASQVAMDITLPEIGRKLYDIITAEQNSPDRVPFLLNDLTFVYENTIVPSLELPAYLTATGKTTRDEVINPPASQEGIPAIDDLFLNPKFNDVQDYTDRREALVARCPQTTFSCIFYTCTPNSKGNRDVFLLRIGDSPLFLRQNRSKWLYQDLDLLNKGVGMSHLIALHVGSIPQIQASPQEYYGTVVSRHITILTPEHLRGQNPKPEWGNPFQGRDLTISAFQVPFDTELEGLLTTDDTLALDIARAVTEKDQQFEGLDFARREDELIEMITLVASQTSFVEIVRAVEQQRDYFFSHSPSQIIARARGDHKAYNGDDLTMAAFHITK